MSAVDVLAVMSDLTDLALESGGRRGEDEIDNEPAIALYEKSITARASVVALVDEAEEAQIKLQGYAHLLRDAGLHAAAAEADQDAAKVRAALARCGGAK